VLPYLGAVKIAGMTPSEASAIYLEKELKDKGILVDPQVSVSPGRFADAHDHGCGGSAEAGAGSCVRATAIAGCDFGLRGIHSAGQPHDHDPAAGGSEPITVLLSSDPKEHG
jgi:hypothetical protein